MIGTLDQNAIDQLLRTAIVGRIGYYADGEIFVVPISYVYDGEQIYARSLEGMKLHMMRIYPEVCFEVDLVHTLSNWQSVIARGTFEELEGDEAAKALRLLAERGTTLIASGKSVHRLLETPPSRHEAGHHVAVYRIRLTQKTGRFETEQD